MTKLKSEDLSLNIIVNGNKAQSDIASLGRTIQDTQSKVKGLEAEQRKLEKQGATQTRRYKELTHQIRQNNTIISEAKNRQQELIRSLSLESKTIKQLRDEIRHLSRLRDQSVPGTSQYDLYNKQLSEAANRLQYLRSEAQKTGSVLSRMAGNLKSFAMSAVGQLASITALALGVGRARDEFAQFDDKIADVVKTTNASKEAILELNAELEKIDTRTSQDDLLGLARIGGKLGITDMDELRGFVESTNQVVVALNEDLGGNVEQTITAVGKLVDIFGVADTVGMEQGLLKIGSAINELGMASTANEGYMVEFARRMAGVAPLAGITVQQILGLGATLDQLGQTSEVSSTALNKLFLKMASDAKSFAKYAGMDVTAFKDLLEKDFLGAFTKVLEGVKGSSNGINELASTLGDLGLDGGRIVSVLGSLANNTDILTGQIDLANQAFEEGTSLTEEYNVKNSTAAAELDKARKEVTKFWRELGRKLWPAITVGNNLLSTTLQVISQLIGFLGKYGAVIITATAALIAYNIAVRASVLAIRAKSAAVRLITAVQWAWNAAIAANPIGLLVSALAAAGVALVVFSRRLSAVDLTQRALNDAQKEAAENTAAETANIRRQLEVLGEENRTRDEKLIAINKLREIMPDVLQDYTDEEILAGKATAAIEAQTKAILQRAKIAAKQRQLDQLTEKRMKAASGELSFMEKAQIKATELLLGRAAGAAKAAEIQLRNIQEIDEAINKLADSLAQDELAFKVSTAVVQDFEGGSGTGVGSDSLSEKELKKAYRAELELAEKAYQEQLKAAGLYRKEMRTMTAEELNALADLQSAYQEKVDSINKKYQQSETDTTNAAERELTRRALAERKFTEKLLNPDDPLLIQEQEQHENRLRQAGLFGLKREEMTAHQLQALERLEAIHADNIGKIDAQLIQREVAERQRKFETELADIRIRNNEELASVKTLEEAKAILAGSMSDEALNRIRSFGEAQKLLREKFNNEENELMREHATELLADIQKLLDAGELEGINLSDKIISEDEEKEILDTIRKLKMELAKLRDGGRGDELENRSEQERGKQDVLGMTIDDWDRLFDNIAEGKVHIESMFGALEAGMQLWKQYNAFVAAGENRQLQQFQEANNRKKEELDRRLKAGTISQENYNDQVERLNEELDRKKARIDYNQAKRERDVALTSAIVNTAMAVTKALPNLVLAYLVGAMGALQVGTILRTPLPSISGREEGGYFVRRSQDGKVFNAAYDPDRRGYVKKPTVIVGENGDEFVANAQAVSNPSIRPVLDVIDTAQRNGTISTLNLEKVMVARGGSSAHGRETGGFVSHSPNGDSSAATENTELRSLIAKNTETISRLNEEIRKGIRAEVALLGKNGFYEKDNEYKKIQESTNI